MENKLLVPDIGDFEKVEIIEILVKKGLATLCVGGGMGIAMCIERD